MTILTVLRTHARIGKAPWKYDAPPFSFLREPHRHHRCGGRGCSQYVRAVRAGLFDLHGPGRYVDLILNGDPEAYLRQVPDYIYWTVIQAKAQNNQRTGNAKRIPVRLDSLGHSIARTAPARNPAALSAPPRRAQFKTMA